MWLLVDPRATDRRPHEDAVGGVEHDYGGCGDAEDLHEVSLGPGPKPRTRISAAEAD